MAGVSVGDIGPKLGANANDNGYLMLDHVRVPRENMLMRFSRVRTILSYLILSGNNLQSNFVIVN